MVASSSVGRPRWDKVDPKLRKKVDAMIAATERAETLARWARVAFVLWLAFLAGLSVYTLSGCSVAINPDTSRLGDSGAPMGDAMIEPDAGTSDAWVDPTIDAGTDSGTVGTCGGLPLGDITLTVTSSTCDGPFSLAQSLSGRVLGDPGACRIANPQLRVVCDHMYVNLPLDVGGWTREGTTYTSEDTFLGCEGTTYMCRIIFDAATSERRVDCSLDIGRTWCVIDLE